MKIARNRLLPAAALAILLTGGYSLWWYHLAQGLRDAVDHGVTERREKGWTIETGPITTGGFPLAMRLTLAAPVVADPRGDRWQGPPLTLIVSPLNPGHPRLQADGQHLLSLDGRPPLAVTLGQASVGLTLDTHGLAEGTLSLDAVQTGEVRLAHLSLTLRRLAEGTVGPFQPSLGLSAELSDLDLPADTRQVPGPRLTMARLEARVMGSLASSAPPPFARWRDDGGVVEIDGLSLAWPPLQLSGKATLALDGALQPLLAGTATIRGLPETIDQLTRAGVIKSREALLARVLLGVIAKPGADGVPELTLPVTVQNRHLTVGPVTLLQLPEIRW